MAENQKLHFEENSRVTSVNGMVMPSEAAILGYDCGMAAKGSVFLCHGSSEGAYALAHAFAAGVAMSGTECIWAGECTRASGAYAARELGAKMGCYINTGVSASFTFFSSDGLPLPRCEEDRITDLMNKGVVPVPYGDYGRLMPFDGTERLYCVKLRRILSHKPEGFYADVYSPSDKINLMSAAALEGRNEKKGTRIAFHINSDENSVCAYSEETGYVFHDRLLLICYNDLFRNGIDAAVCGDTPHGLERLAKAYGRRIIGCGNICTGEKLSEECKETRKASSEQLFAHDSTALMLTVIDILAKRSISLKEAVDELPVFSGVSRYVSVREPSKVMARLCTDRNIAENSSKGRVTIRPVRTGMGLMLYAESTSAEIASELCDIYEDKMKHLTE